MDEGIANAVIDELLEKETLEKDIIKILKRTNPRYSTSEIRKTLKQLNEESGLISPSKHVSGEPCWKMQDPANSVVEDSEPFRDSREVQNARLHLGDTQVKTPVSEIPVSRQPHSYYFNLEETPLKERAQSDQSASRLPERHKGKRTIDSPDETPLNERISSGHAVSQLSQRLRGIGTADPHETPLKEVVSTSLDTPSSHSLPYEINRHGKTTSVRAGDVTVKTTARVAETKTVNIDPHLQDSYDYVKAIIGVLAESGAAGLTPRDVAKNSGYGTVRSDVNKILYFLEKRKITTKTCKENKGNPIWSISRDVDITDERIKNLAAEWKTEPGKKTPAKNKDHDTGATGKLGPKTSGGAVTVANGSGREMALPSVSALALTSHQNVQSYEDTMRKILSLFHSPKTIQSVDVAKLCQLGLSRRSANPFLYFLLDKGLVEKVGDKHWKISDSGSRVDDTGIRKLAVEMEEAESQNKSETSPNQDGQQHQQQVFNFVTNHFHKHEHNNFNTVNVLIGSRNEVYSQDPSNGALANPDSQPS